MKSKLVSAALTALMGLSMLGTTAISASAADNNIMYCSKMTWLRHDPSCSEGNEIRHVYANEYVYVDDINTDTGWVKVTYPCDNGNTYYGYIQLQDCQANESDMVSMLQSYLGVNYSAAVAIYSNMHYESSGDPNSYCIDTNDLPSYGLCQWNGPRYEALKEFSYNNGLDYHTADAQLKYLKHELETSHSYVYNQMLSADNSADGCYNASYYWAQNFEVCASRYWETRANYAYNVFSGAISRYF